MRALAVAVLLAAAGCGAEPESAFPDPGGLYSIEGETIVCPGCTVWYAEPDNSPHVVEVHGRECFRYEERDVRRVDLTFRRDSAVSPWRHTFTGWSMGACP